MRRLVGFAALLAACGGAAVSSSTSDGNPTSSASCSPLGGTYERGKGGGAPECCAGLSEIPVQVQGTGEDGGVACFTEPLAAFICVTGKCGDGICEAPENQLCTCPQDCSGTLDGG